MSKNKKRKKGRIQIIKVPAMKLVLTDFGHKIIKNPHPAAGKTIQIKHIG